MTKSAHNIRYFGSWRLVNDDERIYEEGLGSVGRDLVALLDAGARGAPLELLGNFYPETWFNLISINLI